MRQVSRVGASLLALLLSGTAVPAQSGPEGPPALPPQPSAEALAPGFEGHPAPPRRPLSPGVTLARIVRDPEPSFHPESARAISQAADIYWGVAVNGGWPSLPEEADLAPGDSGPLVAALKNRLVASGDLAPGAMDDRFDEALEAAVKRFQRRHGLPEAGRVGPRTVRALNVPADARAAALSASARRLAESKFAFGERYVAVNIPSASVEAVRGGRVERHFVAVVGKPDRATPMVETRITNINANPTWTAPISIVKRDLIPKMRRDPQALAKMRIRILDVNGREVDPAAIDWNTERAADFTLRQDAGGDNSLGRLRIDMPNRHAVYLHDSPAKSLFGRDVRFHSSGCVRVAEIDALAAWLLEGTGEAPTLQAALASGERRDIRLTKPVPVAWVYLTGWVTPDGTVHFRDDVYGLDRPDRALPDDVPTTASIPASRRG